MSSWLVPFGMAFGALAAARVGLYRRGLLRQTRLGGPVISVGNLSLGGTGKTPVVARIAALLGAEGLPVAVLSRGYRGRFRGDALVVGDGERVLADAREAGDEPVMLARALPGVVVAVGSRRDVLGRRVESIFGARVYVLDDGFQHLRLARDLDLLCVDALEPKGWPLPAGRQREFASAAGRADVILLTQADRASEEALGKLEGRFGPERTYRVGRRVTGFSDLEGRPCPAPVRPFVFSGIAKPGRLVDDVRTHAGEPVGAVAFPDHHRFSVADLEGLAARARTLGAGALVTTAKDAVRLPAGDADTGGASSLPIVVLHITVEIRDEERLKRRLLEVARRVA